MPGVVKLTDADLDIWTLRGDDEKETGELKIEFAPLGMMMKEVLDVKADKLIV